MPKEEGTFWDPRDPERTVRGILEFGQDTRPLVTLFGFLMSTLQLVSNSAESGDGIEEFKLEVAEESTETTLHGFIRSSPRRVSLVGCTIIDENEIVGLSVPLDRQVLSALHIVQGAHVSGKDQLYESIQVRVAHIDEWANIPGFAINEGHRDLLYLKYEKPFIDDARTSDGISVEVTETITRSFPRPTGGHISRESWIRVSGFEPQTFSELSTRYVTPVTSGLSILIGVSSPIMQLRLKLGEKWCDIWFANMAALPEKRVHLREILLPLPICGIGVIANLIDLSKLTGPVTPVIADSDSLLRTGTLETQVLELTTLAEGLHRAVFDEEVRFTPDDADRIRGKIDSAIADEPDRHRQIISGFLSHMEEPNYRMRIRQLAELAEEILPGISGRTNRWVDLTDRARNAFAHRTVGYLDTVKIDEYYVVSRSLLWILRAVILVQVDANSQACADWVRHDSRYQQYLRNMRSALPRVFDQENG